MGAGRRARPPRGAAAAQRAAMLPARAASPSSPVRTNTIFTGALSTDVPSSSTVKEAGGGWEGGHEGAVASCRWPPWHDFEHRRL